MKKRLVSKWLPLGLAGALVAYRPAAAADLPAAATPAPADTPSAQPVATSAVVVPAIAAPAMVRDEFSVKGSILLQSDARVFSGDEQVATPDQFTFRRLQPGASGTFQKYFGFRVLTDFAGNKFNLLDANVDFSPVPYAGLRVGKFKSPLGLEVLQGSGALVLAERSFPSALAPGYDTGLQLFGDLGGGVVSYALALVDGTVDGADADVDLGDSKEGVARLFVKPFARTRSPLKQLGLGAAASFGRTTGNTGAAELPSFKTEGRNTFFKYASATDATGKLDLAKTAIADGRHTRWTAQGNYYVGPVGLQAEYVASTQRVKLGGARVTPTNRAWQAAASYVIGGEASYAGVKPRATFDPAGGKWGALELSARYAELVVDDDLFAGETFAKSTASARRARVGTGGLSWYLNRNVRINLDYARTTFEDGARDAAGLAVDRETEQLFVTRFQTSL